MITKNCAEIYNFTRVLQHEQHSLSVSNGMMGGEISEKK